MQWMAEEPGLRSVYAPAYHVLGGLLWPLVGPAGAVRLLGFAGAALLIAGFRSFQRAAGLPEASAALFCFAPYSFALSWCLPKVEAAGYGLAFFGLACLLRRRAAGVALLLAACLCVHTAAGLFFGLCGGLLALWLRDRRALVALATGSLLAAPLFAAHLAAGCSLAQALLFSQGDYLRSAGAWSSSAMAPRILALAGPLLLGAAALGAARLWREQRAIAVLAAAVTLLYLNEIWLAPFGVRTTLNLLRGLTILAFPLAAAAGYAVAGRPRHALALTLACGAFAVGAVWLAIPGSCHRVPIDLEEVSRLGVDRCSFRWSLRVIR